MLICRFLSSSQTLIRPSPTIVAGAGFRGIRFITWRFWSGSSDGSSDGGDAAEIPGFRRLEDAIHNLVVMKAAPSWLPFIPGSSYWVPPRRTSKAFSDGVMRLVTRINYPLTEEEKKCFASVRGWPSSEFYLDDLKQEDNPTKSETAVNEEKS